MIRRFVLRRYHDVSGVSGTGVVAEGVVWSDGTAAVRWLGRYPSTVAWQGGLAHIDATHGHGGRTAVSFLDPEDDPDATVVLALDDPTEPIPAPDATAKLPRPTGVTLREA